MQKNRTNVVNLLTQLEEIGFTNTFRIGGVKLKCIESEKYYGPDEIKICGTFRYEGMSDPDDSRVVYALEATDGTKGLIVDAFGTYACPKLGKFLETVHDAREEMRIMESFPAKKTIEIQVA